MRSNIAVVAIATCVCFRCGVVLLAADAFAPPQLPQQQWLKRSRRTGHWGLHLLSSDFFRWSGNPPKQASSDFSERRSRTRLSSASASSSAAACKEAAQPAVSWFPRRIQETVDYDQVVERLYVRHIVTETKELAEWVLQQYTATTTTNITAILQQPPDESDARGQSNDDIFALLARQLSACPVTRHEGGKIGWIDRSNPQGVLQVLPVSVIARLFAQQPKAGDVLILPSHDNQDDPHNTPQWHTIQVMELWTALPALEETLSTQQHSPPKVTVVGSHGGRNLVIRQRRKLKGHGVLPVLEALSTYHIQTAGCQMNVADSERLEGILQHEMGLTAAESPQEADLLLFNTCSIRDHAEQKLYNAIGPYAARKRSGNSQRRRSQALVVTGCVAQQEGEALLRRIPEIDIVLGPQYVPHLQTILEKVMDESSQIVVTAPTFLQNNNNNPKQQQQQQSVSDDFASRPTIVRGHSVRAWVNVIFGCNEHCTYCVVPATRGMEQSRTMESILQECLDLYHAGYKEVTLLGQNIDAYGRDMVPKRTFAELLEYLNARLPTSDSGAHENFRIRYVTSHPRYFSDRVIDAVANLDKVCECFHVPFQAGDNAVLKAMRRGYTHESYMRMIRKIQAAAPDAALCGDVIVGFPGETEQAFQRTLQLMEAVKFDNLNTFAYSPRPSTEAAEWPAEMHIAEEVKADRLQRVQALAAKHGLERSQRYVGRTLSVLVEDANPRNPSNQVMGRTRQGRQVYFDGDLDELKGAFVSVHITEARTWSLMGERVK